MLFRSAAEDTIKVGVLHSLSGTMAISETTLKDTVLMLIDEQNKKGGVLGKKLEAVVVDPASNWPLFAEKASELIDQKKVSVVFGCWTSVSRKSVLPVFEKSNSLLFYPVQYEGEESSKNVIYTGAAPNQQAIPAVDYLMKDLKVKRWVLEGTDYVYPRTTNKILEAYLKAKGVKAEDIIVNYTPFGFSDWQSEVSKIKAFGSAGKKTAVVSTINGDANVPFYKELGNQKMKNGVPAYGAGKAVLNLPEGGRVLSPVAVADADNDDIVAVTTEGHMLVFRIAELPQLPKGKGNKIISIASGRVSERLEFVVALCVLARSDVLTIYSGKRHLSMKPADLEHYRGERGRRGNKLPRGFQNVDRVEVVEP